MRVWFQIPRTIKVAPASKQTSIWLWLPWLTPHWQVRTRANAVRAPPHRSLLALAAEFDGMISSRGVCVCVSECLLGGGNIVTPLLASAREAALWLQLQHTAVSIKADRGVKPAAPRSRVRRCCAETPPTTAGRRQLRRGYKCGTVCFLKCRTGQKSSQSSVTIAHCTLNTDQNLCCNLMTPTSNRNNHCISGIEF